MSKKVEVELSSVVFGEAIKVAKLHLKKGVSHQGVTSLIQVEFVEKYSLSGEQLICIGKAVSIAQDTIAYEVARMAHIKNEIIRRYPGLMLLSAEEVFAKPIIFTNGQIAKEYLVRQALNEVREYRIGVFNRFLANQREVDDYIRSVIIDSFPDGKYMDPEFLSEPIDYFGRKLPFKVMKGVARDIFYDVKNKRKAEKAEKIWREKAVNYVRGMYLSALNTGNTLSESALLKSTVTVEDRKLSVELIAEGIKSAKKSFTLSQKPQKKAKVA